MGRRKTGIQSDPVRPVPAATMEARENQLISLAVDLVEKRLMEGTASSAEVVHFLRLGSTKEKLEKEKLKKETTLLTAKTEALESNRRIEELYTDALRAMSEYRSSVSVTEEYDD